MNVRFNVDPYQVLRNYQEIYPSAAMKDFSWAAPEGVKILAQVQIRAGDPYFWVYLPRTEEEA